MDKNLYSDTMMDDVSSPELRLVRHSSLLFLGSDFAIGTVFIIAALTKWADPFPTIEFIENLGGGRTPSQLVVFLGLIEWVLGTGLLSGFLSCFFRAASGLLLAAFIIFLGIVQLKDTANTCPCLGLETSIPLALLRNGVMLTMIVVILFLKSDRGNTKGVHNETLPKHVDWRTCSLRMRIIRACRSLGLHS